jgi:hypothetical protein
MPAIRREIQRKQSEGRAEMRERRVENRKDKAEGRGRKKQTAHSKE